MSAAGIATKLDDIGTPAWIAVMVLGFIIWWPLGLATLAFILWSGRMGCHARGSARWEHKMQRMQERMERMKGRMDGSRLVGQLAVERQRRLRRIQDRDAAAARRGAEGVPRLPRPPAHVEGPRRVRSVHGRAPSRRRRSRPAAADLSPRKELGPRSTPPDRQAFSRPVSLTRPGGFHLRPKFRARL